MILGRISKDLEFELKEEDLKKIVVEQIEFEKKITSLRINGKKYDCKLIYFDKENNSYTIKVNGQLIVVNTFFPIDNVVSKIGLKNTGSQKVNELRSPMPGLIIEIPVSKGDIIKKDQSLIILEAMKMENVLTSPINGKIADIKVNVQDTVEKNNLLITFENE